MWISTAMRIWIRFSAPWERFGYTDYTNKESLRDEAKAVLDSLTPLGTTHIGNAIKVLGRAEPERTRLSRRQ